VCWDFFGITRAARTPLARRSSKYGCLPRLDKFLAGALGCILFIEGLAAMAPLTGSDALHYHFTLPAQICAKVSRELVRSS